MRNFLGSVVARSAITLSASLVPTTLVLADENLFGYVKGSEVLPSGAWEFYQVVTQRSGKSVGGTGSVGGSSYVYLHHDG